MRTAVALAIAGLAFGGAHVARSAAKALASEDAGEAEPFAPSPSAAPFVSLGYREAAADVLFVRLRGYFGGLHATAEGTASLAEAVAALDPQFLRIYEYGAHAMILSRTGVTKDTYLRAVALLERGAKEFPNNWRIPMLAGQIYTQDLADLDPSQRRTWDEKGTLLVETAIRKPGAPAEAAEFAAVMRTKFGEHARAVEGLREMLLLTSDTRARQALIERLAKLEAADAAEVAAELLEQRHRFEAEWLEQRPGITATFFVLLGRRLGSGFDLTDLATGGRDLVGAKEFERLERLD